MKVKVAAPGCEQHPALDRRAPDNFLVYKALQVLQDWISIVTSTGDAGVRVRTQQQRVGTIDPSQSQLIDRPGNYIRICPNVAGKLENGIARNLPNALYTHIRISLEDNMIFSKG